jgi:CelD/BcsL family acetyltransferase involved in cellulose biosynthesis
VRRHGCVVAVLPLYEDAGLLRLIGSPHADRHAPPCEDVAIAGWALREIARRRRRLVLADRLPGEAGWERALGGRCVARVASPRMRLTTTHAAWLAAQSAATRRDLRRRERRLVERGTILRRLEAEEAVTTGIDTLLRLHAQRWGTASNAEPGFTRAEARLAARQGWLRLWLAEVEGVPVAASLSLRHHGREYLSMTGRDPAWSRWSVGSVLLHHTIREAFADGVREYHLLRGDQEYKARYADADDGVITSLVGAPALVWAARAALGAVRRSPQPVRRVVYTGYGL